MSFRCRTISREGCRTGQYVFTLGIELRRFDQATQYTAKDSHCGCNVPSALKKIRSRQKDAIYQERIACAFSERQSCFSARYC